MEIAALVVGILGLLAGAAYYAKPRNSPETNSAFHGLVQTLGDLSLRPPANWQVFWVKEWNCYDIIEKSVFEILNARNIHLLKHNKSMFSVYPNWNDGSTVNLYYWRYPYGDEKAFLRDAADFQTTYGTDKYNYVAREKGFELLRRHFQPNPAITLTAAELLSMLNAQIRQN